jgi:hypothetical protein
MRYSTVDARGPHLRERVLGGVGGDARAQLAEHRTS